MRIRQSSKTNLDGFLKNSEIIKSAQFDYLTTLATATFEQSCFAAKMILVSYSLPIWWKWEKFGRALWTRLTLLHTFECWGHCQLPQGPPRIRVMSLLWWMCTLLFSYGPLRFGTWATWWGFSHSARVWFVKLFEHTSDHLMCIFICSFLTKCNCI